MTFSKINYESSEPIFDIKIIQDGATVGKWKFQRVDFVKWVTIMSKKYGITLKTDLDWLKY